jgi:hypothetical protein
MSIRPCGSDGAHVPSLRSKFRGRRLGERAIEIRDHHTGALFGEDGGNPATDPLRATRHDCDLIGESLHGAPPLGRENIIGRPSAALLG